MKLMRIIGFAACLFFVLLNGTMTFARNGTELMSFGGRFTGMGGACLALHGDPACMITNPAGIAGYDGKKLDIGAGIYFGWAKYKNDNNPEETSRKDSATTPVTAIQPLLGYIQKVEGTSLSFGIGFYGVGGGGSDYSWFSADFNSYKDIESSLGISKFTPTIAYEVSPKLFLGISPNIYYIAMNDFKTTLGPVAIDLKNADAWGLGVAFGMVYKFNNKLSVGFSYTSQSYVGDLETNDNTTLELAPSMGGRKFEYKKAKVVDFQHPQKVGLGIAYQLFPWVTLATDIKWLNYSSTFEVLKIELSHGNGPDQSLSLPLEMDDQWLYSLGLEFRVTNRFKLRCGYRYASDTVSGEAIFPPLPAVKARHQVAFGFGYRWDSSWSFDFAWAHMFLDGESNDISKYDPEFNGSNLKIADNHLVVNLTYYF